MGARAYARVGLAVMGAFWNSMNCQNEYVRVGPYVREGTNSGGFGGWVLRCHDETWQISFTGEEGPWYDIIVKVCQYEPE